MLGKHELWPTLVCCPPPKSFCWLRMRLLGSYSKFWQEKGLHSSRDLWTHSAQRSEGTCREGECGWMHSEMPAPKNFKSSWGDRPAICTKCLMNHGKQCKIESECFVSWYLRTPDIQRSGKYDNGVSKEFRVKKETAEWKNWALASESRPQGGRSSLWVTWCPFKLIFFNRGARTLGD